MEKKQTKTPKIDWVKYTASSSDLAEEIIKSCKTKEEQIEALKKIRRECFIEFTINDLIEEKFITNEFLISVAVKLGLAEELGLSAEDIASTKTTQPAIFPIQTYLKIKEERMKRIKQNNTIDWKEYAACDLAEEKIKSYKTKGNYSGSIRNLNIC